MSTIHLPEYDEWIGTDQWRECIGTHHGPERHEDCPLCIAFIWMPAIHAAVFGTDNEAFEVISTLSDGYGPNWYIEGALDDAQGWDWSGIRDSSPAAIGRMAAYLGLPGAPPWRITVTENMIEMELV